jgi:hypothetical protein
VVPALICAWEEEEKENDLGLGLGHAHMRGKLAF